MRVYSLLTSYVHAHCLLQAKFLKIKLLLSVKDYSAAISETGFLLKEDEDNLEALLLRGRAYYYLADHDIALRYIFQDNLLNSSKFLLI